MNILHHKSYHVYNRKNIEKVKADEAEAERQAKIKQDRVTLAESESRLTILRQRANANLPAPAEEPIQHINLFEDQSKEGNQEHEAEVKAKDDQWDKQITMYLEKGTEKAPWYAKESNDVEKYIDKDKFKRRENNDHKKNRKRKPIQLLDDPLDDIKKQLQSREERKRDKHDYKRKKADKHKVKETGSSSIEELRKKRREREQEERARTDRLFLGPQRESLDERNMSYNSQFNKRETEQAHYQKRR